jgi:hypothetical protein
MKFFQFPILDMKNAGKKAKKFIATSELDIQLRRICELPKDICNTAIFFYKGSFMSKW